jgi:cytochrome P450
MTTDTRFDIDDPAIVDDPYPTYARLRATCPVGYTGNRGGYYYVSDYENVRTVFRDPELFSSEHVKIPIVEDPLGPEIPLELGGDEHRAWRELLDPLFSMRRLETYRPMIREHVVKLLEGIVDAGECDFMMALAIPFPSRIFCVLMGLPPEGLDQYLRWGRALAKATSQTDAAASLEAFKRAREGVMAVFDGLREERLAAGFRDDVVSHLLQAEIDGEKLTGNQYHAVTQMLFVAGLETVTSTLGNITWFLAENDGHRRRLAAEPEVISKAVEELLRYESIASVGRVVTRDVEFGGCPMKAGDRVLVMPGSAGRDERQYADPDEVIFDRASVRHLAFGAGPHRCLGSHLARQELLIGLTAWHERIPDYRLDLDVPVREHGGQVGLDNLPLVWDRR